MGAMLDELEAQAMKLTLRERGELAHRLLVSLNDEPDGTSEEIAKAWDEEIARRVAEIDAGTAVLIPEEEVFAEIDEMLKKAGA
jgi:putative addiction module component (TIGR02574 family)